MSPLPALFLAHEDRWRDKQVFPGESSVESTLATAEATHCHNNSRLHYYRVRAHWWLLVMMHILARHKHTREHDVNSDRFENQRNRTESDEKQWCTRVASALAGTQPGKRARTQQSPPVCTLQPSCPPSPRIDEIRALLSRSRRDILPSVKQLRFAKSEFVFFGDFM